jgi:hypothetical protein
MGTLLGVATFNPVIRIDWKGLDLIWGCPLSMLVVVALGVWVSIMGRFISSIRGQRGGELDAEHPLATPLA